MADKEITVAVPQERVPEFYAWFAAFLAADPGSVPPVGRGGAHGRPGWRGHLQATAWSAQDADQAAWLYRRLAPPARELVDRLLESPHYGERWAQMSH